MFIIPFFLQWPNTDLKAISVLQSLPQSKVPELRSPPLIRPMAASCVQLAAHTSTEALVHLAVCTSQYRWTFQRVPVSWNPQPKPIVSGGRPPNQKPS